MKNSFVMYTDWKDMIEALDDKSRSDLLLAIFCYQAGEEIPEMTQLARVAFACIQTRFEKDKENYEETCEKRREAGKLGGRPPKTEKTNGYSEKQKKQMVFEESKKSKRAPDNDNENDNDYKRESTLKGTREKFEPPTVEQVKEYATEKGYAINADSFVDFYASKGWMVGKNKMKDWKAAVRNWNRSDNSRQEKTTNPVKKNQFSNFDQRQYDYDELERELLQRTYGGGT